MTRPTPLRVGVFFSGAGSNLKAILEACSRHEIDAEVALAITNRPAAAGIAHAQKHHAPLLVMPREDFPSRAAQQAAMAEAMLDHRVELIVQVGFDQILREPFVKRFGNAGINLHPSLLPAFGGGLHAVHDALNWGVKVTGVTVHFATEDLDAGPIILQEAVRVEEDDTEETLLARVQEVEHRLVPAAIQLIAEDRLRVEGRRVRILPRPTQP